MAISKPNPIVTPFAVSGSKNTIPVPSQVGIDDGKASYVTGFPPITMKTIASGGVPPEGFDMNGILFEISNHTVWQNGGGIYKFDADVSSYNSGYPAGAILWNDAGTQTYMSMVDNNTTNFNTTPSSIGVSWQAVSARVLSGMNSYNTGTVLTAANDANKFISLGSATFDVTIPLANLCPAGTVIELAIKGGTKTIKASGTNQFSIGATLSANFQLTLSGFATLTSDGNGVWVVTGTPALPPSSGEVPIGGVIIYSGSFATIPANWALCDGQNGTPDLRDKFVMGAGGSYAVGASGGSNNTSISGAGSTSSVALTASQIPPHKHLLAVNADAGVAPLNGSNSAGVLGGSLGSTDTRYYLAGVTATPSLGLTSPTGGGEGHEHTLAGHTHTATPPYIAFGYIRRQS